MTRKDEAAVLAELRDAALALLAADADPGNDDTVTAPLRTVARARYERYVADFGPLNRGELRELRGGRPDPQTGLPELALRRPDPGGFRSDPHYLTVMALEVYDVETGAAEPAPILHRRVHGRPPAARIANVREALVACGTPVDLARVAALAGLRDEAARSLLWVRRSFAIRMPAARGSPRPSTCPATSGQSSPVPVRPPARTTPTDATSRPWPGRPRPT